MSTKVAVVTGSNKGIGFAIVRGLCKQFNGAVYLTARNEVLGKAAVEELEKEGLKPLFHQLDITDATSRGNLAKYLKEKYGGLDILVNNAGIAYPPASPAPFLEQAEVTLETNYFSTVALCDLLFPLLRDGARVVHVSSMLSLMNLNKCGPELAQKLKSLISIEQVSEHMQKFIDDVRAGRHKEEGWPQSAYGVSKIGITLMTPLQQVKLQGDVVVNSCCPGFVATDLTGFRGTKSIEEGADTPIYLALLPPNTDIRGEYLTERKVQKFK